MRKDKTIECDTKRIGQDQTQIDIAHMRTESPMCKTSQRLSRNQSIAEYRSTASQCILPHRFAKFRIYINGSNGKLHIAPTFPFRIFR